MFRFGSILITSGLAASARVYRAAAERFEGLVHLGMTDLGR